MGMPKKRGPKPNYIVDPSGNVIEGLSLDRGNMSYYTYFDDSNGKRCKKYFGRDISLAISNFLQFKNKTKKYVPSVDIVSKRIKLVTKVTRWDNPDEFPNRAYYDIVEEQVAEIPEDFIWQEARKLILKDKYQAAQKLGIKEIAFLDDLPPGDDPISMKEIVKLYTERTRKPVHHKAKQQAESWWEEFADLTGAENIREVGLEQIEKYQNYIWKERQKKDASPRFIKNRFDGIKAVLNNALKKSSSKSDIQRVLTLCKSFEYPEKAELKPQPITKEDFQKILGVADLRWKAILLTALNCGMYPKDIHDLLKTDINLKNQELVMKRQKTGVYRVAVLWDRTCSAINDYLRHHSHNSAHLFLSSNGSSYEPRAITKLFAKYRKRAKVSDDVQFAHIRDGSQTAAARAGCSLDQIRFLLGHKVGSITDHYLMRSAHMTKVVCETIEKSYFG